MMASKTFAIVLLVAQFYYCNSQDGHTEMDWWQNTVLYQIYPRSFRDSDGDGIGDLKGIISKLDYLKETGIEVAWLSPIFQSPMVDFGYDISNFTAIHDEYGSMQDFEDLLFEANRLDIKIILDFVPNHSSDKCEWFVNSINRVEGFEDFYVWHDGKLDEEGNRMPPNNWQSVFYGSAWTWNEQRQQYYLHQFAVGQPDLNYRNPKVVETMDKIIRFWLDKGVAGFRVDAVNHLFEVEDFIDEPLTGLVDDSNSYGYTHHYYTKDLPEVYDMIYRWREILNKYKKENGGDTRIMLTEAYANITCTVEYYENSLGRKGSHLPFNFYLITDLNDNSDARDFLFTIEKWLSYMPLDGTANWVLGNHDNPRVGSRYGKERCDAMNMLLLTLPGVAVTYNGEEIGMIDFRDISWKDTKDPAACNTNPEIYKLYSRDPERTPFQWDDSKNAGFSEGETTWLPLHPDYKSLNLAQQKSVDKSHYKLYKKLVQLRKHHTFQSGTFHALALNRKVLAYKREFKDHDLFVIVINLGGNDELVNLQHLGDIPDVLTIVAVGSSAAVASSYKEGNIIVTNSLTLGSFESLVLQGVPKYSKINKQSLEISRKIMNGIVLGLMVYCIWKNKIAFFPKRQNYF